MVCFKNLAKELEEMALLYHLHILKQRIALFEKKHNKSFQEFEREVLEEEDFEKWDDYMEWKAFVKEFEEIEALLLCSS